jgi:hypothetical protein
MVDSNRLNLVEDNRLDIADAAVVAYVVVVYLRPYPRVSTDYCAMSSSMGNRRRTRCPDAIGLDKSLTDCA